MQLSIKLTHFGRHGGLDDWCDLDTKLSNCDELALERNYNDGLIEFTREDRLLKDAKSVFCENTE